MMATTHKNRLLLPILVIVIMMVAVMVSSPTPLIPDLAADLVTANGPYPAVGLYWYLDSNPTAGAGMPAPDKQLLIRTDTPSIYYKSGTTNTAWTQIGSAGGAGTVSSITCGSGVSCTPNPITTTGTINVSLPTTTCPGGQAEISTAADGSSTCAAFGNTTSAVLTANKLPIATAAHTLGDSVASQDAGATTFSIGSKFAVTVATGALSAADGTLVVTAGSSAINTSFWQVNQTNGTPISIEYATSSAVYVPTADLGTAPGLSAGCGTGATVSAKGASKFTILTNATALGTCVATFSIPLASASPTCTVTARNAISVVYDANATTITLSTGLAGGVKYDVDCNDH
jgi:hypothetical protein